MMSEEVVKEIEAKTKTSLTLVNTTHVIMLILTMIFIAGGSWAITSFRIGQLEKRTEQLNSVDQNIYSWINKKTAEDNEVRLRNGQILQEIRLNMINLCRSRGLQYISTKDLQ